MFDSYLKDFLREILINNRNNSVEAMVAFGIFASAPIPNYLAIRNLIKEFPQYAERLSEQMTYDGLYEKLTGEVDWVPIEYAVGRELYGKYVNENNPMPTYKELAVRTENNELFASTNSDCTAAANTWINYLRTL